MEVTRLVIEENVRRKLIAPTTNKFGKVLGDADNEFD